MTLRARLSKAQRTLTEMSARTPSDLDMARLRGKSQGVGLALSYLDEDERSRRGDAREAFTRIVERAQTTFGGRQTGKVAFMDDVDTVLEALGD